MATTNKHKSVGPKKKQVKQSWWTPERIKAMLSVCAVLVVIGIGIAIYQYVSGLQSSVVGTWAYSLEDQGDEIAVEFHFNEDKTCEIIRDRNGENEADMTGTYSIDEKWDYLVLILNDGEQNMNMLTYDYTCKGNSLKMRDIDRGTTYECTKVTK